LQTAGHDPFTTPTKVKPGQDRNNKYRAAAFILTANKKTALRFEIPSVVAMQCSLVRHVTNCWEEDECRQRKTHN
jgi:hypothetical protein